MTHSIPCRFVVFDLDGLLIDTEPTFEEAARRLLSRRGKELDLQVMREMMGTPAREALPWFAERHQLTDALDVLAVEYRADFFAALGEQPVRLLPGALELLDLLKRNAVPHGMATSSTLAYVERVLTPHRILPRFAFILTADDVQKGKPHPEIYEKAAARFGCRPDEMLVLEDSVNGLRSAKAAGARCVVVPHELVDGSALTSADAVAPSLMAPGVRAMLGF